jgi:xanthine dehydrogenase molybdopterin-binding subunit B
VATPGLRATGRDAARHPGRRPRSRARPSRAPLRREGPAKLIGEAKYADDLVFPGAWFGATIRSTDPHARLEGIELDDAFDWKRVVVVTSDDIPGENLVSLIQDDQPVLVPVGGEIRHQAEPCALIAAPDRATLRAARSHVKLRTQRLPPRSTRSSRITSSPTTRSSAAMRRPPWRRRRSSSRARTGSATRSSCTSRTRR